MKKVSVIIPFYNANLSYLKQAIESALRQTICDIEVICIDDGSTNCECYDFISTYKDERIKLIRTKHHGSGNARNIGILNSDGENIVFLDADDYYADDDTLKKLYNLKRIHKTAISGAKHLILNNEKLEEPYFNYGNINEYFCNKTVNYKDYQFPWWYWCFMFDIRLIKENKIFFPNYIRYQDPPFFVRAMHKAGIFYAADFVSYIHRASNKLSNLNTNTILEHVKGISDVIYYAKLSGLDRLKSLLYNTFYSFDIKLFDNVKNLSQAQKDNMIKMIENAYRD